MIFNEIYSAYYNAVAKIIAEILRGETDERVLERIVCEKAFGESMLTVLPSLKSEKWQLVKSDMTTPIKHPPTMPLTLTQKEWLKAISLDKRIKLFDLDTKWLDDVEPLFCPEDIYVYDRYSDADPYDDEEYRKRFRMALSAIKTKTPLRIRTVNRRGNTVSMTVMPTTLEYSEKDDKFRLLTSGSRYGGTVNLSRIVSMEECPSVRADFVDRPLSEKRSLTLMIRDERNALERAMLHFAHFEKRAERIGRDRYLATVTYDSSDETELVIRVLSFGPLVEVKEPESFRKLIKDRLKRQKSCGLF